MSSNPLMIVTEVETYCGLALSGQQSGRCPGLCVQAVGSGLCGQWLWVRDESALEVAPPDRRLDRRPTAFTTMRYTITFYQQLWRHFVPFNCTRFLSSLYRLLTILVKEVYVSCCTVSERQSNTILHENKSKLNECASSIRHVLVGHFIAFTLDICTRFTTVFCVFYKSSHEYTWCLAVLLVLFHCLMCYEQLNDWLTDW